MTRNNISLPALTSVSHLDSGSVSKEQYSASGNTAYLKTTQLTKGPNEQCTAFLH